MDFQQKLERQQRAARVIQAFYRGHLARKAYQNLKAATQKIQAHARGWYTRKKVGEARDRTAMEQRFQAAMARHRERLYVLEKEKRTVQAQPAKDFEVWDARRQAAARTIQAAWRGLVQRRKYAQRNPDRARRDLESQRIHRAFKEAMAHQAAATAAGLGPGGSLKASSVLGGSTAGQGQVPPSVRASVRQSATVLMGSPEKGALQETEGAWGGFMPAAQQGGYRDASHMSQKRYAELEKQVEQRVESYMKLARRKHKDQHSVDQRLKELLNEYQSTAAERLSAAHARQQRLVAMEALVAGLDHGGLVPLSSLVDPQASDYPRPAQGSERWERATQAHALALADARVGANWWRHLRVLNRSQAQQALLQEDQERWQEMDSIWRRQWSRVMATEQRRPDPLAEFKRGKPALSDIAVYDQGTGAVPSTQGGTVAGAGGTPPRPGYGLQYPGSPGGISGAPAPSSSVPGLQTHAAPHMSAQPPAAAPHTTGDGRGIADQGIAGAPAPAGGLQGGLSGYGLAAETQAAAPGVGVSGGTSGISIQQYPGGSHVGHTTAPGAAHQQPPAPPAAAQVVSGVMGLYVT